jgi:hypothetical protein
MEKALLQDANEFPGADHSDIHKPEWTRFADGADESIRLLHAKCRNSANGPGALHWNGFTSGLMTYMVLRFCRGMCLIWLMQWSTCSFYIREGS